jgi:hypothetical protein
MGNAVSTPAEIRKSLKDTIIDGGRAFGSRLAVLAEYLRKVGGAALTDE